MFEKLNQVLTFIKAAWSALPRVIEVARKVEALFSNADSNTKKEEALNLLQNILTPKGWCEQDWHDFLSGLIDATVALLHWRGIFKHKPGHPCAK